ncbi:M16 family metallopeptidase [Streptomyces sp. NPDC008313]|uniref:M16 family metallopeptidase n=1 Tax=Streptomyces sp. NPDC008313 TaxID=3364826 RepID=UPI0036E13E3D
MTTGRTISTAVGSGDRRTGRVRPHIAAPAPQPPQLPLSADARLPNGLWVTAVRLATVARVEVRLTLPLGPGGPAPAAVHSARAAVLAACVLRGVTRADGTPVETALGRIGGDVVPLVGGGCLALRGGVLADGLDVLLRTLADALSSPERPETEVTAARTVLGGQTAVARTRPAVAAHALLCRHAPGWAGDPQEPPAPELIAAVTPAQVRESHARILVPARARLVLVGDLDPEAAVHTVREAFAGWSADDAPGPAVRRRNEGSDAGPGRGGGGGSEAGVDAGSAGWDKGSDAGRDKGSDVPRPHSPGDGSSPVRTIGLHPAVREGTAQVRLCAARDDEPLTPALRLAALVLGGHAESRLVARLRQRHGYTYAVRCRPEPWPPEGPATVTPSWQADPLPPPAPSPGHRLLVEADTAPGKAHALLEALGEELARMAADPPSAAEVALALAHFTGASLTTWATQAGLADALAHHLGPRQPAGPAHLWELVEDLRRAPADAVAAAGAAFRPARFTGVVIGAEGPPPATSRHWTFGQVREAGG